MDTPAIRGILAVVPLPFHLDESIDEEGLRRVVDFCVDAEVAGICLPAYGSEFYKLSEEERETVVGIAIEQSAGRVPVVAQANHGAVIHAMAWAKRFQEMGADVISLAAPRMFALRESDLLRYFGRVCEAIDIPLLVQDFNPGGATVGADFIDELHSQHANFQYTKLEEPLMADKMVAIRDRVGDQVSILEGWGGYYMPELMPLGIAGAMPGVPIADALTRVFNLWDQGQEQQSYELFYKVLPFIAYTLEDFEHFLQVEKRLLVARGVIDHPVVRDATRDMSEAELVHTNFVIDQVLAVLRAEEFITT